ncbi:hypothetical protein AB0E77_00810 [Streptomyces sp. NPDC032940]|uniref:hypothetical protein n=1 Tax=Streptomyces sp. NPDC032940 TaxID=3155366 RepID=UPI003411A23D
MSGLWGDGGAYQAWVDFLRRWAAREPVDPAALPSLTDEHFDADTWVRLGSHLTGAFNTRLGSWADALVRALDQARDEFSYGRELTQARAGLREVRALAGHPGLPESLRTELLRLVDQQIPQVQEQLEQQLAEEERRGADRRLLERRRRTLRDNALTGVLTPPPPTEPATPGVPDPWAADVPGSPPRRRIVPG